MSPETTPPPDPGRSADRPRLLLLASGHFVVDMTVGAISPLLPAFRKALSLSDLRTSIVLAAVTLSSSLIQPLFGVVADRVTATWFLWGGVGIAGAGLAVAGLAPSWWLLLVAIVVCGLGVGAYHPEAARLANHFAGTRKASGVAWFTMGGNIGFAFGPLAVALLVPAFGEATTLFALVPAALACALLLANRDAVRVPVTPRRRGDAHAPSDVRGMAILVGAVSLRTWAQFGLMAIVPLYLTGDRGLSDRAQGLVIFTFVITGAAGTMFGSAVADRIGDKALLVGSLPFATPLIALFIVADGALSVAALAATGFALMASFASTVVMGQRCMPSRHALAAAWVLGFGAIGAATPWLPFIGALADAFGRESALWVIAAVPLAGTLVAALAPSHRTGRTAVA